MIQRFITVIAVISILTPFTHAQTKAAAEKEAKPSSALSTTEIDKMIAENKIGDAMTAIDKALEAEPKNLDMLARQSRILTLQGNQAKKDEEKVRLYEKAQKVATQAIKADSKSAQGYLRRAIAKGKLILYKGILESRTLVLELRADTQKVLKLKNTSDYEKGLANYLLGKTHIKLAEKPKALRLPLGLAWASEEEGQMHLKKAYELKPTSIPFVLDYALVLRDKGEKAEAIKLLESIEPLEIYDPADVEHKATAKKTLAKLTQK
jgi:hypothetical protein